MKNGIDRREFLKRGAAAGVGLGLLPLSAVAAEPPRVRRRVRLGRTGLQISDVSFGSSRLSGDVGLVHHALDRGIGRHRHQHLGRRGHFIGHGAA